MYRELINTASESYPFLIEHRNVKYIPHFHRECEIVYLLGGEVELSIDSEKRVLEKGDIAIIPSGVVHNLCTKKESRCYVIKLYPTADAEKVISDVLVISSGEECHTTLSSCIESIKREDAEERVGFELAVNIYSGMIILTLLRELEGDGSARITRMRNKGENSFIKSVIGFLESNYASELTLESVCTRFGYTKSYFCRYFKRLTGNTFWDYYTMFRLEKAVERIKSFPEENIISVANLCGFKNVRSFNQAFKSHYGCTPAEYRKGLG